MSNGTMLSLMNFGLAVGIAWVCLCRLNLTSRQTMIRVRLKYVLILVGSLMLAGMPVFFAMHYNALTLAGVLLLLILVTLEMRDWRHGPPSCTNRTCPPGR